MTITMLATRRAAVDKIPHYFFSQMRREIVHFSPTKRLFDHIYLIIPYPITQ